MTRNNSTAAAAYVGEESLHAVQQPHRQTSRSENKPAAEDDDQPGSKPTAHLPLAERENGEDPRPRKGGLYSTKSRTPKGQTS